MKVQRAHVQKEVYKWKQLEVKEFSAVWEENCFDEVCVEVRKNGFKSIESKIVSDYLRNNFHSTVPKSPK
jgi:hypothetical protein